jgi:hypothetical protein
LRRVRRRLATWKYKSHSCVKAFTVLVISLS